MPAKSFLGLSWFCKVDRLRRFQVPGRPCPAVFSAARELRRTRKYYSVVCSGRRSNTNIAAKKAPRQLDSSMD
eukprot:907438-Amphidinium_carterae.1